MGNARRGWLAAGLLVWLAAGLGCGNQAVTDLLDKAKTTVAEGTEKVKDTVAEGTDKVKSAVAEGTANATQTVQGAGDQVKQQAGIAGNIELLSPPVKAKGGYVSFVSPNAGRPGVLQVRSYRDPANETFPSVYIHAPVTLNSLLETANETVAAQVFVQTEANGPIWFSREPVQIKLDGLHEKSLMGAFVGGKLVNSHTGEMANAAGKFLAVLP